MTLSKRKHSGARGRVALPFEIVGLPDPTQRTSMSVSGEGSPSLQVCVVLRRAGFVG